MKRTNRVFGIAVLATMILATTVLNGCGCDNNKATPDSAVATVDETTENTNETNTTATYADGTTIAAESANTNATAGNNKTATTATGTAVQNDKNKTTASGNNQNTNNSAESKNTNSGNNNTNNGNNTGTNKSNSANTNNSGNGKTWHDAVYEDIYHPAETKQVKVVDKEAYSYEEPVYDYVYHAICNTCGADITDDPVAHTKVHTLAHEGGSWSDIPKYEQVGTKTVTVPEQSHYETQTVKAAWTEHKLVREAGWY